ncbi:uncharacterized protein TNCV_2320351 [Trichonephila clavipes]|nr:uncharacterized protein TNCV_2320351 [Trichonephila clavipes]
MKQAIWAIFFHKISTDLNPQHGLCPLGDDSWCGYNRSKLKGDTYKHKHNLPIAIMHCIKKVFRDLSSSELLSRCLHGKTQNCNESLNSVIWSIIPKAVFVQLGTLKTGVYESISIYNQGLITKLKVLDLLNIQPGFYKCRALQEADHARIRKAEEAISRTKEARIKNRQLKCRQEDDLADDPSNPSYGSEESIGSRTCQHGCQDVKKVCQLGSITKNSPSFYSIVIKIVVPARISSQSSHHCWRSPLPHASALIQRDFGCVLGVQQIKQLPHVAKVDLHPLSTMSPDSNPTIVVFRQMRDSSVNFIPFCHPHPSFVSPFAVETSVVLRQG